MEIEEIEQRDLKFHKDTGFMAPGKSVPPAQGPYDDMAIRLVLYRYWLRMEKLNILLDKLEKDRWSWQPQIGSEYEEYERGKQNGIDYCITALKEI